MSRRPHALLTLALAVAVTVALPVSSRSDGQSLGFMRDGKTRNVARSELAASCGVTRVTIEDPYYDGHSKTYLACPLANVLRRGFEISDKELAGADVIFRASDGYARPAPGSVLTEDGGWLAFSDADRGTVDAPAWDPIDRKKVDPGPYYVVWSGAKQRDAHRYPWPYQLVQIELTSLAKTYPFVVPAGAAAGSPELAGFELFKNDCIACHSVNGQGGKVGPDLNVPRSIVEYRPEAQIKEYIRNPLSFRYTNMPAHEYLSDAQLDQLVAYFRAMSRHKHDPGKPS